MRASGFGEQIKQLVVVQLQHVARHRVLELRPTKHQDAVEGARCDSGEALVAVADDRERLSASGLAVREDADVVAVDRRLDQVLEREEASHACVCV